MIIFVLILVASLALFLIGANVAFLLHWTDRLVPWFTFKISAVTLLLTYVAVSTAFKAHSWWTMLIALAAVVVEGIALYRMWIAITENAAQGITGLVPILRDEKKKS